MLRDARLVVAGVASADGAGWAVARRALLLGAHVTLVAPPALLPSCRALALRLGRGAHAVCADLDRPEDVAALHEHLRCAYRTVDGALHATAPEAAADGSDARTFAALGRAVAPLLPPGGGSLVALAPHAQPGRPSALEDAVRELARELAATGGRANLVAAGPRGRGRTADAACFLLSALAQNTTGQVLHVDGRGRAGAAPTAGRR